MQIPTTSHFIQYLPGPFNDRTLDGGALDIEHT